jgi:hypothetical protein
LDGIFEGKGDEMMPYGLMGDDLLRILDGDRRQRLQSEFRKNVAPPRWRVALGGRLVVIGARLAGMSGASSIPRDVVRQLHA